jgi:uncharacterized protein (TIGR03083 family)
VAEAIEPVVGVLAEEWSAVASLCSQLDGREWELPTECPGWTVRDVLSHLVGTERSLLGEPPPGPPVEGPAHVKNPVGAMNEAWVAERRGRQGAEVLDEFAEVTGCRLSEMRSWPTSRFDEVVPSPVGRVPYREFMSVRVMDTWVHEQDIRVATDRPGNRSGAPAALAMRRLSSAMGFVVAKKAGAPEGSVVRIDFSGETPSRLDVAVRDGRGVILDDLDGDPTAVLAMDQETFRRLCCGRVSGDGAVSSGLVVAGGDEELAVRVVRSMPFMI